jgi:phage gp29-like protein
MIYSDSHILVEFTKRKLAVLGDRMRLLPYDADNADDRASAKFCKQQIDDLKSWRTACAHLLDGTLWPVAVVEKVYRSNFTSAKKGYDIQELIPVPHYLLDYSTGKLMIRDTDKEGNLLNTYHEPWPERYIVHRGHLLPEHQDNFGGPLRSLVFWWMGSTMSRDWWLRFLDRNGMPFIVGKYKSGQTSDRNILTNALALAKKTFGLVTSHDTEVELVEASKQSADAFHAFVAICQREKSKLILGQTLSAQTDSTGLGSGVADLQGDVRDDIRQFDAAMLSDTLRDQLLTPSCQFANISGRTPRLVWGSISAAELSARAEVLKTLNNAGLEVDDDGIDSLSEEIGIGLQRKTAIPGFAASPFSAARTSRTRDIDRLDIETQAADLVPLLRDFPAQVAQTIRTSATAQECENRLATLYANHSPEKTSAAMEQALQIYSALAASKPR